MSVAQLHRAASIGWHAEVEAALVGGAQPDAVIEGGVGSHALHTAAEKGHAPVCDVLLRAGALVDARDHYGATALHYAAAGGHLAVMRVLLERGADIDAPGRFGRAPLHAALPHPEAVRLLLDCGAQLEACDKREWTALHWSVADGHCESARLLLERGADVDAAGSNGWTPLFLAARNEQLELVSLLLGAGADVQSVLALQERGRSEHNVGTPLAQQVASLLAAAAAGVAVEAGTYEPPTEPVVPDTPSSASAVAALAFEALGLRAPSFLSRGSPAKA